MIIVIAVKLEKLQTWKISINLKYCVQRCFVPLARGLCSRKMHGEMPYVTIFAFYVLSFHVLSTNSRTSTLWKLNSDENKIVEASPFHQVVTLPGGISEGQFVTEDDPIFNIITSTVHFGSSWTKQSVEYYCTDCPNLQGTASSFTNK